MGLLDLARQLTKTEAPKTEITSDSGNSIESLLQEQIKLETEAMLAYDALSCWADSNDYVFIAQWLLKQASEEREHRLKFINLMYDLSMKVTLLQPIQETFSFENIVEMFEKIVELEIKVGDHISKICKETGETNRIVYAVANSMMLEQQEELATAYNHLSHAKKHSDCFQLDLYFKSLL